MFHRLRVSDQPGIDGIPVTPLPFNNANHKSRLLPALLTNWPTPWSINLLERFTGRREIHPLLEHWFRKGYIAEEDGKGGCMGQGLWDRDAGFPCPFHAALFPTSPCAPQSRSSPNTVLWGFYRSVS